MAARGAPSVREHCHHMLAPSARRPFSILISTDASATGPSSCTGFVHRPARANSPSTFDRVWLGAAMLFLSGCIQGFALDGWRELTENYPAWVEGPTTWTRRSVFVGGLAMGFVLVWQRVQGRRGGKQA